MNGPVRREGPAEMAADRALHGAALAAAAIGIAWLLAVAPDGATRVSIAVYALGLFAMLGASAAYNFSHKSLERRWLCRLDHAAIFLMIAGTYTPFTVNRLNGTWSVAMTGAVWGLAVVGIALKLASPRGVGRASLALYLGLGWIGLVAIGPLTQTLDAATLTLLGTGGVLYSAGTIFLFWRALRFHTAIWHGCVIAAAGCHYAAVLHGVVLA